MCVFLVGSVFYLTWVLIHLVCILFWFICIFVSSKERENNICRYIHIHVYKRLVNSITFATQFIAFCCNILINILITGNLIYSIL